MNHPITPLSDRATGAVGERLKGEAEGAGMHGVSIWIPLKTVSEANMRGRWHGRHYRGKGQKESVRGHLLLNRRFIELIPKPHKITLTRVGKKLLDDDNLQSSFKAIRDEIADFLKINDGDRKTVHWKYHQLVGKEYAVCILIASRRRALSPVPAGKGATE